MTASTASITLGLRAVQRNLDASRIAPESGRRYLDGAPNVDYKHYHRGGMRRSLPFDIAPLLAAVVYDGAGGRPSFQRRGTTAARHPCGDEFKTRGRVSLSWCPLIFGDPLYDPGPACGAGGGTAVDLLLNAIIQIPRGLLVLYLLERKGRSVIRLSDTNV